MNKKDLFYIPKNWERELERSRNSSISQKLQIKRGPHAKLIGNTTLIGDDIYIEKYKNHSGTRFVWKRLNLSDDLNLYVLRDALNHDEYDDKYNCCRDTAVEVLDKVLSRGGRRISTVQRRTNGAKGRGT